MIVNEETVKYPNLYDISFKVTEPEYRADEAYSASQIGSYQRDGIEEVAKSTSSLLAGSVLDTLCTDVENFYSLFEIADVTLPTEGLKDIAEEFISAGKALYECTDEEIYVTAMKNNYGASNWKVSTVVDKVKNGIGEYVELMVKSGREGKRIITPKMFLDATEMKSILIDRYPDLFNKELPDHQEVYYQLKFKAPITFGKENSTILYLRSMLDIIKVDHEKKTITPIDLKTKWDKEEQFVDSFFKWRYVYQSGIYSWIINKAIIGTPFSEYIVEPFQFIVISNNSRRPFRFEVKPDVPFNMRDYKYNGEVIPNWVNVLYDMHVTRTEGRKYKLCENNGFMNIELKNYI